MHILCLPKVVGKDAGQIQQGRGSDTRHDQQTDFPQSIADEEIMVPVDMRGVEQDFDDVEQMIEKLGPKGAAEAFVKAKAYFDANKDKTPEDERPQPMTSLEWKQILAEDMLEGGEEESMEGDEEDF